MSSTQVYRAILSVACFDLHSTNWHTFHCKSCVLEEHVAGEQVQQQGGGLTWNKMLIFGCRNIKTERAFWWCPQFSLERRLTSSDCNHWFVHRGIYRGTEPQAWEVEGFPTLQPRSVRTSTRKYTWRNISLCSKLVSLFISLLQETRVCVLVWSRFSVSGFWSIFSKSCQTRALKLEK